MKLDILAFAAHPDDVELSAAGVMIKEAKAGKKTGIVDLTRGELGTRGSAELRDKEAEKSAKILGLSIRHNLGMPDGFFEENETSLLKIVEQIRRFRPEVVLCNAPSDRHPDHGRAAKLVARACFLSGLIKITTSWENHAQEAWRPKAVYHYIQDRSIEPDVIVDITGCFDMKMEAVKAFSSQFYDPSSDAPQTPISSEDFLKSLEAKAILYGRLINVKHGEAYICDRTPGVQSLSELL